LVATPAPVMMLPVHLTLASLEAIPVAGIPCVIRTVVLSYQNAKGQVHATSIQASLEELAVMTIPVTTTAGRSRALQFAAGRDRVKTTRASSWENAVVTIHV
jgi:hypothetical protein